MVQIPQANPKTEFIKKWICIAFLIFLFAALLGLAMRYFFVSEIPFLKYKHILHAHSHIALMGWAFMLVSGAYIHFFDTDFTLRKTARNTLFLNTVAVIGMAITFILQGYAFESIAFSALHLFTAYYFGIQLLRATKNQTKDTPLRFLKWSIYFYFLSSLGLLAIGPISNIYGALHPMYTGSIQFFIHFQFNGWFTFGALAVITKYFQNQGHSIHFSNTIWVIILASVGLTYLLSVTWSTPLDVLFYLNAAGVILQGIGFTFIFSKLVPILKVTVFRSRLIRFLFLIGIGSLLVKVLIQMIVVVPAIAVISYTIHNYVIAFIHLIMLGSITFSIGALLIQEGIIDIQKSGKAGWIILAAGFLGSEFILFGQGTLLWIEYGFIPFYYEILLGISTLLPIGVLLIFINQFGIKPANLEEIHIKR